MRDVAWHTYPNARDLGGLPTLLSATGMTEFGRVVRGPRREIMTAEALHRARAWGLRHVVDLRCADEVGVRDGDPVLDGAAWQGISIELAAIEDHNDPDFARECLPRLDSPAYWPHNIRILPAMIAGALRAIMNAGPGVLVHCAAGRDRTGLVTTLLLANAGVPAEAISADYAASVRAMAGTAHHGGPTLDRQSLWTREQTEAFLDEAVGIVEAEARRISETLEILGITDDERERLRDLLIARA